MFELIAIFFNIASLKIPGHTFFAWLSAALITVASAADQPFQLTTKPPAIPLAVKSPYFSTWLHAGSDGGNGGYLAGRWPQFHAYPPLSQVKMKKRELIVAETKSQAGQAWYASMVRCIHGWAVLQMVAQ